jgi:uncharacterized lipoprotein YmbA
MHTNGAARLILLCGLMLSTGCFALGRTEPPQRHYVLGGDVAERSEPPAENLAGLAIGVRRLRLAAYLDPPFLVVREGPQEISYAEYHRWGEQLGGGINRAVAGYLAARAPFEVIDLAPWPAREEYDYVIQLQVERFEGLAPEEPSGLEGEVYMLATWEIVRQEDGTVLARGATEYREPGWVVGDYAGLVRSLDTGLNRLSGDLATGLEDVVTQRAAMPATNAPRP